ncbi:hypothetical protein L7F22_020258 [Adiantum nelumboides]|nr:hypothetical protein [Adiantum nelumboides]
MFRKRLRVSKSTFEYICSMLAPAMKRQNTRMRRAISLEDRVALSLHRLASGANVKVLADLYGCARSTGSIHDSVNFSRSELGKRCENGMLNEFCFVEDCAYSARPYMLVPFKGSKDGLPDDKYYWNFIQSSTRMAVERAFGMLKARFRILLKRCDMDLRNMPSLVVACLVLHNICVVHKDQFNMEWIRDAEVEVQQYSRREQGRMTSSILSELQAVRPQTEDQVVARGHNDGGTNVEVGEDDNYCDKDAHQLGSNVARRENLARVMYKEHTRRNAQLVFGTTNTIDNESDSAYDEAEGI